MPREKLAQLLLFFMPRQGKPLSFEEFPLVEKQIVVLDATGFNMI